MSESRAIETRLGARATELASELIARPSVTPEDAGCQEILVRRLEALGFEIEQVRSGPVENFWARRGRAEPLFAFAGHTDVVPPGPETSWRHPAFEPTVAEGRLWGRGAADMKGSVAAMVVAAESFLADYGDHRGSIGFLITGAEETLFHHGTPKVVERLEARGEKIDWCLVGEPSSRERSGDRVRVGRRGSLLGRVRIAGVQGHVAEIAPAENAAHLALPALAELAATEWDAGNDHFPPTGFHLVDLRSGVADNVTPSELRSSFNFRYSTETSEEALRARVEEVFARRGLEADFEWISVGRPFLTPAGELLSEIEGAITDVTGRREIERSTAGGTSDGRFIAPTGAQVVELGPPNATIHKVDENVAVEDLEKLVRIYRRVLERLLLDRGAEGAGA